MTKRARIALLIISVAAVAATIVIYATNRRSSPGDHQIPQATKDMGGMAGMPGMAGMSGMSMSTNGTVALTADHIRALGVTFGSVEMRPLTAETRANAVVSIDETRITEVAPKFSGFVERLYANATGQTVRRGQALMDVYAPDLVAAQQELILAAQVQRNVGTSSVPGVAATSPDLVMAARRRLALWDISDDQIDEILRTGRPRRTLTIYATASGVVTEKRVVDGQAITAGQTVLRIADLGVVWIDVQLRAPDAAAVPIGTAADIDITGLPGRPFKGRVTYLYPTVDSATRTVAARIVVNNIEGLLRPGMYATVRLRSTNRTALTVPALAVLRTGTRNVVFMDMGNGQVMPMEIELGRSGGDYVEVLAGLEPGQRVVTSAQFLLDSESSLAEVMRSMIGQMGR